MNFKLRIRNFLHKIDALLSSEKFYYFIVGFFIFEAVWIAFSALYPQAFDENFHFGLIKVYSHYWLPFLSKQPPNANAFGAVAHDPSYLYHYLMSFPYRLIALFVHSQTLQVITLRIIDIAFFASGLLIFHRVLQRVGLSRSLSNVTMFLFVLIPIVPQLAAQVSYDDLLFPLVGIICLLTFKLTDEFNAGRLALKDVFTLAIISSLTSLVKYAFLPILLSVVLFLLAVLMHKYRHNFKKLLQLIKDEWLALPKLSKILLPTLLVISLGLFAQRDIVNLIKYDAIEPDCAKVLNIHDCTSYSPWSYNYTNHHLVQTGASSANEGLLIYTRQWFYWMWYRLFFAVNGLTSSFATNPPLPIPSIVAAIIAIGGFIALIIWRKRIFRHNPYLVFLLTVCLIYGLALYLQGYSTYKYTAVLENMNGRYLIPILLPLAAMLGLAFSIALRKSTVAKAFVATVVVVLFLQGGGLLTFILRSDETWYWPNSTIVKINKTAHKVAKHVVIKSK